MAAVRVSMGPRGRRGRDPRGPAPAGSRPSYAHVVTPGPLPTTPLNAARANGGTRGGNGSTCRIAARGLRRDAGVTESCVAGRLRYQCVSQISQQFGAIATPRAPVHTREGCWLSRGELLD